MDDEFPFDLTEDYSNIFPFPSSPNNNPILVNDDNPLYSHELFNFDTLRDESSSLPFNGPDNNNNKPSEINERKIMHREIERLRRKEMTTLHASLRSLLPQEFLKGKRSISEHMDQAVNYIKHLENNVQELSNKRDVLRNLSNPISNDTQTMKNSEEAKQGIVTVRPCSFGIEVVISTAFEEEVPLSRILQVLIREGLRIIHCNSTKVNGRLFHTIESELDNDGGRIDMSELQQKLTSLITQS